MSMIHIRKKHKLGQARARKTADELAKSLAADYNAKCKWHKDDLKFKSKGVQGLMHVGKDEVEIKVDLGMMLRPFKGKIESSILAQLEAILDKKKTSA